MIDISELKRLAYADVGNAMADAWDKALLEKLSETQQNAGIYGNISLKRKERLDMGCRKGSKHPKPPKRK